MKKILWLLFSMLLSGSLLTGCGSRTITIGEMSKDFSVIEITDSLSGNVVTLEEDKSQELYGKLKEMEFVKDQSAKASEDGLYTLRFLKDTRELDQFEILDKDTIVYNGYTYNTKEEGFDLEYLMSLFYQVFDATVIENDQGLLVAPAEDSAAYRSSDKISVGLTDTVILDQEGKEMSVDQLKAGDSLRIAYNGVILESYPAQITAARIDYLDHNLLLDCYLLLIDDLYQEDSGLNGDISIIAFDTTGWVGLTDSEKKFLLFMVQEKYGMETLQGSFDELAEQGLIDKENLYFESGILIELKDMEYKEETKTLTCSISKWRSGLGAIGADVKAVYEDGEWKITKTNNWIS